MLVPFISGTVTLTNMLAADTELPAIEWRVKADLSAYTKFRITCRVATAGTAGADLRFQGSINDSAFSNLDGGAGPEIAINTIGEKDTGWLSLAAGLRVNDLRIRMMGKDGNGTVDPVVRQILLHFK